MPPATFFIAGDLTCCQKPRADRESDEAEAAGLFGELRADPQDKLLRLPVGFVQRIEDGRETFVDVGGEDRAPLGFLRRRFHRRSGDLRLFGKFWGRQLGRPASPQNQQSNKRHQNEGPPTASAA